MRVFIAVVLTASLSACGAFAEMQAQSSQVSTALEKDLGTKPNVSWRVNNGSLVNVSVTFSGEKLSTLSIGEVEAKVHSAVTETFKQRPQHLIVAFDAKE